MKKITLVLIAGLLLLLSFGDILARPKYIGPPIPIATPGRPDPYIGPPIHHGRR